MTMAKILRGMNGNEEMDRKEGRKDTMVMIQEIPENGM